MSVQIGGPVGAFLDRVQQRNVPVTVIATCEYTTSGAAADPMQVQQHVQMQMLRAIREVVGRKMDTGELTFRHLGTGQLAGVIPEIIAASGVHQSGIQVGNLSMAFGIDGHEPRVHRAAPTGAGQQPPHDLAAGTFDLGGGHQLHLKINGMTPEKFVKNKAEQKVWGWVIGFVIVGLMVLTVVGVGAYVLYVAKKPGGASAAKAAAAAHWDGKSTFECGGNDVVVLSNVTATAGVKAAGNCALTLNGVNITAPVGIEAVAGAKVVMTGGSINASTNAVVASANAQVDLVGTKVSGKAKRSANAKVTGMP